MYAKKDIKINTKAEPRLTWNDCEIYSLFTIKIKQIKTVVKISRKS